MKIASLLLLAFPAVSAFSRTPFGVSTKKSSIVLKEAEEDQDGDAKPKKVHSNPWKNQITDGWDEPTPGPHRSPWAEQNVDGYEYDIGLEKAEPGRKPSTRRSDETPDAWKDVKAVPGARKSKGKEFVNIYQDQATDGWDEPTKGPHKRPFGGSQAIDGYELDVGVDKKDN
jgi:hypothetical protein